MDFSAYIREKTRDFTGRGWVLACINDWLQQGESRTLLLTGAPGTGKTAIAARLVQLKQDSVQAEAYPAIQSAELAFFHFCQAFNDVTLSPLRFVEAMSQQFACDHQAFKEALLKAGTQDITINAQQTVASAGAHAEIKNVVIESVRIGNVSPRAAFDLIVRKPLEQLCTKDFSRTLVVVVDSLDEALTFDPEQNIVNLLVDVLDHAMDSPPNVRWLLTSRPDQRILKWFGDNHIDVIDDEPRGVDDVHEYTYRRLEGLSESERVKGSRIIADAAKRNFLYAYYVVDEMLGSQARQQAIGLRPATGLEEIYQRFLDRELGRSLERWEERFRPLLGVLAVAQGDGLNRSQLAGIAKLRLSEVDGLLRVCRQYLSGDPPDGPFRIYHHSFRDFLLSEGDYRVYPDDAHQDIAAYFLQRYHDDWAHCGDDYALLYTPTHLMGSSKGAREASDRNVLLGQLCALLTDLQFMLRKLVVSNISALIADYDLARDEMDLQPIASALRLGERHIGKSQVQLLTQLSGRLSKNESRDMNDVLAQTKHCATDYWLRPLTIFPTPATEAREEAEVVSLQIYPDGKYATAGTKAPTLCVHNLTRGTLTRTWTVEFTDLNALALLPEGRRAIIGDGRRLILWDMEQGKSEKVMNVEHRGGINAIATFADGAKVLCGSAFGELYVWDVKAGRLEMEFKAHEHSINCVAITPDGRTAVSGSNHHVKVWDLLSKQLVHTLDHTDPLERQLPGGITEQGNQYFFGGKPTDLAMSGTGKVLLSGSTSTRFYMKGRMWATNYPTLWMWDLESGEPIAKLDEGSSPKNVKMSQDGRRAVTLTGVRTFDAGNHTVTVWDLERRVEVAKFEGDSKITAIDISQNGDMIAVGDSDGNVYALTVESPVEEAIDRGGDYLST